MVVRRLEPAAGDDVNPDSQEVLKVLEQANLVQKRCAWIEIDKQVDIAVDPRFSSGNRAEDRDTVRSALARDPQYLGATTAECFDGRDVSHIRSVAPCPCRCLDRRWPATTELDRPANRPKRRASASCSWYSTEVPQQVWTGADGGVRARTATCKDARRRTGCVLMACKRSGVRIP